MPQSIIQREELVATAFYSQKQLWCGALFGSSTKISSHFLPRSRMVPDPLLDDRAFVYYSLWVTLFCARCLEKDLSLYDLTYCIRVEVLHHSTIDMSLRTVSCTLPLERPKRLTVGHQIHQTTRTSFCAYGTIYERTTTTNRLSAIDGSGQSGEKAVKNLGLQLSSLPVNTTCTFAPLWKHTKRSTDL